MTEPRHSPAPFRRHSSAAHGVHLVKDALGDTIGSLAYATGDHPADEQLANAQLFTASAELLQVTKELVVGVLTMNPDHVSPLMLSVVGKAQTAIRQAEGST